MNFRLIFKLIGKGLKYEGLLMILPLAVSFYYRGSDSTAFIISIAVTLAAGLALSRIKPKIEKFDIKSGLVCVAFIWVFLSLFGAAPFYLSGCFGGAADSFFEAVSAITTTGASTLSVVQSLPRGVIFWRSFMQWLGGIGVLVLVLAIMPQMGASGIQFLRAESPSQSVDKYVPKIKETAKIMYTIYSLLTVVLVILLLLAGLSPYDSIINSFGTAATGGFSHLNMSVGAYDSIFVEIVITLFMFMFSVNFSLYYQLAKKKLSAFKDEEFLVYLGITLAVTALVTVNIYGVYGDFSESLRHASFQVTSVISTTCYSTTDFGNWPVFSRTILMLLMFIGGCTGSTSGGLKITRLVVMFKAARLEIRGLVAPRVVDTVKINGKKVGDDFIRKVFLYLFLYLAIIIFAGVLISLDSNDIASAFTVVLGAVSTVGMGSVQSFSPFSKIILSICMLAGRLEIFPVLILFYPAIWKKGTII